MAMKVKGITIELSADTSGLEQALKGINKTLATTQKDLNSVNKALKLDPKNMELVEQKQRLLASAIDNTKSKVDALRQAQAALNKDGTEETQRQYDALTREISETEVKLKNLNQEQKEFSKEALQAQVSASSFGQALDSVSEKANKVARETAAMSTAAGAALAGLAGLTVEASKFADNLLEVSKETGLSTDTLQKMQYAAELVDVPVETIIGSIRKMKKQLDGNEATWRKLGVEVRKQSGDYRDIEDIFYDVVRALGQIENETERDTMAMEIFGKSADDLAGIIDDGGKALRQLGDEAENLGVIVSEEDIERLGAFNDTLERMKSQLKFAAVQAAIPILEALEPVIQKVAEGIKRFAEMVSHLNPKLVAAVVVILAIVAAISPVAMIIANVCKSINILLALIPVIISGLQMINATLASLLANPVVLIIAAITIAVVGLVAAIKYLYDNWDSIGPVVDSAIDKMKTGLESVIAQATELGSTIQAKFQEGFSGAKNLFSGIGDKLREQFSGLPDMITNVSTAFRSFVSSVSKIVSEISNVFSRIKSEAKRAGSDIINAFVSGVRSVINSVTQAFQNLANTIKSIWGSTEQQARSSGQRTASNYASGYNSGRGALSVFSMQINGASAVGATTKAEMAQTNVLIDAINTLNENISKSSSGGITPQVNVELVGSAKNIFDTVRVTNNKYVTATGYHALA